MSTGTLYVLATPIGNLEDLSPRAMRTLREVAAVASEDTRTTRKLLSHFGISKPVIAFFQHSSVRSSGPKLGCCDTISGAKTPALIRTRPFELLRASEAVDGGTAKKWSHWMPARRRRDGNHDAFRSTWYEAKQYALIPRRATTG